MSELLLVAFLGLPLAALGWFYLAAGGVTIGLYILRLRRRRLVVPFLPLWERFLSQRKASALRSRLQRLISLLIALLLLAALVSALGDPRIENEQAQGRAIVVLLDVSASMGSPVQSGTGSGSRLAAAKARVRLWFSALGPGDQMLLVEMGARPRPLTAFTGDATQLQAALEGARVLDVSADVESALALAKDALRGLTRPEIIFVSDGELPDVSGAALVDLPLVRFERVGSLPQKSSENVGIVGFSARRYPASPERFEVIVEVENSGTKPAEVDLRLFSATREGSRGSLLEQQRLRLEPSEIATKSYRDLNHAQSGLVAQVTRMSGERDSFPADDIARTLLAPRVPARVLVVGAPDNFLEAALLSLDGLDVKRVGAANYPPAGEFDVTIFSGVAPARVSRTGAAIYLGVPLDAAGNSVAAAASPFPRTVGRKLELFGFDSWKRDSLVFRLIDPYNIQVLVGHELLPQAGDQVLGASGGKPILVQGLRPEGPFLALGFSPRQSDFVLRTAFPLFIANVVDEMFPRGRSDAIQSLKTGTLFRAFVGASSGVALVKGPFGSDSPTRSFSVPIQDGHAVFFGQLAGFYEVEAPSGTSRFAASLLSTEEAGRADRAEFRVADRAFAPVSDLKPQVQRKPWFWLVLAVLVVSFVEWWTYHRRWTV